MLLYNFQLGTQLQWDLLKPIVVGRLLHHSSLQVCHFIKRNKKIDVTKQVHINEPYKLHDVIENQSTISLKLLLFETKKQKKRNISRWIDVDKGQSYQEQLNFELFYRISTSSDLPKMQNKICHQHLYFGESLIGYIQLGQEHLFHQLRHPQSTRSKCRFQKIKQKLNRK